MKVRGIVLALVAVFAVAGITPRATFAQAATSAAKPAADMALKASEITPALFPSSVFFRGKTAASQLRNTGGVKFADGMYFLAGLVDNSGYSTAIREKYQAYLISEAALEIGGQKLPAGAYGIGWLTGNKFVVMDLGAHELFTIDSKRDADAKHPVPLKVVAGPSAGTWLLYNGRDSVEVKRAN